MSTYNETIRGKTLFKIASNTQYINCILFCSYAEDVSNCNFDNCAFRDSILFNRIRDCSFIRCNFITVNFAEETDITLQHSIYDQTPLISLWYKLEHIEIPIVGETGDWWINVSISPNDNPDWVKCLIEHIKKKHQVSVANKGQRYDFFFTVIAANIDVPINVYLRQLMPNYVSL